MKKGRLIYADEDGTYYVTRKIDCDMRPVRTGGGMHIVNCFRHGGFRSVYEFDCFVVRFVQKQEKETVTVPSPLCLLVVVFSFALFSFIQK